MLVCSMLCPPSSQVMQTPPLCALVRGSLVGWQLVFGLLGWLLGSLVGCWWMGSWTAEFGFVRCLCLISYPPFPPLTLYVVCCVVPMLLENRVYARGGGAYAYACVKCVGCYESVCHAPPNPM